MKPWRSERVLECDLMSSGTHHFQKLVTCLFVIQIVGLNVEREACVRTTILERMNLAVESFHRFVNQTSNSFRIMGRYAPSLFCSDNGNQFVLLTDQKR